MPGISDCFAPYATLERSRKRNVAGGARGRDAAATEESAGYWPVLNFCHKRVMARVCSGESSV